MTLVTTTHNIFTCKWAKLTSTPTITARHKLFSLTGFLVLCRIPKTEVTVVVGRNLGIHGWSRAGAVGVGGRGGGGSGCEGGGRWFACNINTHQCWICNNKQKKKENKREKSRDLSVEKMACSPPTTFKQQQHYIRRGHHLRNNLATWASAQALVLSGQMQAHQPPDAFPTPNWFLHTCTHHVCGHTHISSFHTFPQSDWMWNILFPSSRSLALRLARAGGLGDGVLASSSMRPLWKWV